MTADITIPSLSFSSSPAYTIGSLNGATLTIDGGSGISNSDTNSSTATTLSGNVTLQNSAGSSTLMQAGTGTLVFSGTSVLSLKTSLGQTSGGGNLVIAGGLNFGTTGTTTTITWSKGTTSVTAPATFTYAPTSTTYSGTTSLVDSSGTGTFTKIDIGTSISGLSSINVGTTNGINGAVYLSANGVSVSTPVSIGPTNNSTAGGTYIFGMDSPSTAAGTLSGAVTLQNRTSSTGTYNFDVAANNTLTISGAIADNAATTTAGFGVNKVSAGSLILGNSAGNTYSNTTTVSAGSLVLGNTYSGTGVASATGSGTFILNTATLLGNGGSSIGTGFTVAGSGTTTATRAQIYVGQTSTSDLNTTGKLYLEGRPGAANSTIANANLTFNLDSSTVGNSTQLEVGNTGIRFGPGAASVVLTLNMINSTLIPVNSPYVLIAGNGGAYTGLDLGTAVVSGSGTMTPILFSQQGSSSGDGLDTLKLNFTGTNASAYTQGSQLFLFTDAAGDDDIEVEIVPEPTTWALLIGGFLGMAFLARRRRMGDLI